MYTILQIDKQKGRTGQTKRTLIEAQEISKRGYRVIVACRPNSFLERGAREQSLKIFSLPMEKLFSSLAKLTFFLQKEKVDLINAHGYRDHFLSVVAGKISGVKVVVRTKHNHTPLKSGIFSRFIYGRLTKRVIAISEEIRNVLIRSGLQPEHITTIYSAVNLNHFSPKPRNQALVREFNLPAECPTIGTVARLSERKGIGFLLDALKILRVQGKHFTCLIVGGGIGKKGGVRRKIDVLKEKAESLGISDQVVFTGRRDDIPEILSLIDVFVLPSLAEGLGRSLLEAMAAGKAVIASNIGGIPEAVEDGKTGILVPPEDTVALAQALAFLIDNSKKAEEMGRAGRERAEKLFDEALMIEQICSLYNTLFREEQPSPRG